MNSDNINWKHSNSLGTLISKLSNRWSDCEIPVNSDSMLTECQHTRIRHALLILSLQLKVSDSCKRKLNKYILIQNGSKIKVSWGKIVEEGRFYELAGRQQFTRSKSYAKISHPKTWRLHKVSFVHSILSFIFYSFFSWISTCDSYFSSSLNRYNKLSRTIRELAKRISEIDAKDPFRTEMSALLLEKLYVLGLIPTKWDLNNAVNISASSFCRRRLPVVMVRSEFHKNTHKIKE